MTINVGTSITISGWIADVVAATSIYAEIASNMLTLLMSGGMLRAISNRFVKTLITYTVTANIYNQTIVGNCTTRSKPEGRLPKGQVSYVNTRPGLKFIHLVITQCWELEY